MQSCGDIVISYVRFSAPRPTGRCCLCSGKDFQQFTRLSLGNLLLCPVCNHSMRVALLKEPLYHLGCSSCGHSCSTCTKDPPKDLHVQTTCGACCAATSFYFESGNRGSMWKSTRLFIHSGQRRWDKPCSGCGFGPTRWEHDDPGPYSHWISYKLVLEPTPILVIDDKK